MSFYWVCSGWRCVSFGRLLRLWQTRPNLLGIKLSNITSSGNIWAWVTSRRLFFSSIGGCLMVRTPPGKVPKCVCLCVNIQVNSQWTQHSPDTRFSVLIPKVQKSTLSSPMSVNGSRSVNQSDVTAGVYSPRSSGSAPTLSSRAGQQQIKFKWIYVRNVWEKGLSVVELLKSLSAFLSTGFHFVIPYLTGELVPPWLTDSSFSITDREAHTFVFL